MTTLPELLLIDDQPHHLTALNDILLAHGYRVESLNNGQLALNAAFKSPPALILLACQLPGLDGFEVCRRLKADERTRNIPLLFLTAPEDVESRGKAFAAGGADYLTWPFQQEEVLARVAIHLALCNTRQKLQDRERLLQQLAANYPDSFLTIVEKDLTIGFAVGQQFSPQNLAPGQCIGLTVAQLFNQHASLVTTQFLKTFNGQTTEFELFSNNQHQFYRTAPLVDDTGRIDRILVVVRNETERKQMFERIVHLNAVLRPIRNVNQLIVREKDPNKLIEQSCHLLTETRGYFHALIALLDQNLTVSATAESGIGQAFSPIQEQMPHKQLPRCMQQALKQPVVVNINNPLTDCVGCSLLAYAPNSGRLSVRLEQEGTIYGVLTVIVPVTHVNDLEEQQLFKEMADDIALALHGIKLEQRRRQAEETLRAREEEYRLLVENQTDLVVKVDREGRFEFVSDSYCRLFGKRQEELVGQSFVPLIHEDDRTSTLQVMETLYHPPYHTSMTQRALTEQGWRWLEWVDTAILDEAGRVTAIVGVGRDITERKQTEQALRESEEKLRILFDLLPIGVSIVDDNRQVVQQNPALGQILQLSPQGLAEGKHQTRRYFRADGSPMTPEEAPSQQAYREKTLVQNVEIRTLTETGEQIWVNVSAVPVDFPDWKVIVTTADITERKRVDAITASRLHLLQFSTDHSLEALIEETLNQAENLTGSRIAFFHLVNDDQKSLTFQEWSTRTKTELCTIKGKGMHYNISEAGIWADCVRVRQPVIHNDYAAMPPTKPLPAGHARVIRELVVPVLRGDRVVAILGVGNKPANYTPQDIKTVSTLANLAWEIAERKQAEESLRQLTQAVEQSPVSVMITDTDGVIQYVNPKFSQVTGYSAREAIGNYPSILQSGMQSAEFYRDLWSTITGGREWRGQLRNRKKSGELYWELASIAGVRDQTGKITHFVAVKEDITQSKQLEEEHLRQERLAAVGRLAAGIAHDFNNILTSIIGFADLLQQNPNLPQTAYPDLNRIVQQGQRAARLIRQILDFSRQTVAEPQPLDMKAYLNETLKFLERTIPENIQIQFSFERGDHIVNADPTQLQQVITNLAVNARDAMPEGGTLTFGMSRFSLKPGEFPPCANMEAGEWIKLKVTDTGSGIAPEMLPHIFEPFFTTKEIGRGTGLGLAQIYGIVKQHNGCITVGSQVGQGATFTLYFPALLQKAPAPEKTIETAPTGRGETILLAEDDLAVLEVTKAMLQVLNYQVLTASDGLEALNVYRAQADKIALVLTDAVMPNMDGFALTSALQAETPGLPVLVMTGYTGDMDIAPEAILGIAARLQKPLSLMQLARVISAALG